MSGASPEHGAGLEKSDRQDSRHSHGVSYPLAESTSGSGQIQEPLLGGDLPAQPQRQTPAQRKAVCQYAYWHDIDEESACSALQYKGPSSRYVTSVIRTRADGSTEEWNARRHRRNLLPLRDGKDRTRAVVEHDNPFSLPRDYVFSDTQAYNELRRISFAVGPLFLVSSVLFGMGSIAKEFPGYFTSQWFPDWIDHAVNFPYLVGVVFFLAAAYCSVLEAANVDFRSRIRAWHDGEVGPARPKMRFQPWPTTLEHDFLSYYGVFTQFYGALLFAFGCAMQLVSSHKQIDPMVKMALVTLPFFLGALGFAIGAYLMAVEATGSWGWALLPPPMDRLRDLGRWVQFITMVATTLYLIGGVVGFVQSGLSLRSWQLLNGSTYALGAGLSFLQSALTTFEWICPYV